MLNTLSIIFISLGVARRQNMQSHSVINGVINGASHWRLTRIRGGWELILRRELLNRENTVFREPLALIIRWIL